MRTPFVLVCAAVLLVSQAAAQRHKLNAINAETPEGKLLQQASQEPDAAKKLAVMEQFISEFPKHEAAGWVLSQMQQNYVKANNHDKAIETGEKLLALDADDLDAAYANLKASEAKKDVAGVVKWSGATSKAAKKTVTGPKPEAYDDETWKQAQDYAKQVDTYTEYAVYAQAMGSQNPQEILQLVETLEQRAPQSQYIPQVLGRYAWAGGQANAMDRVASLGDRALGRNQAHEDLLLAMADYSMKQKQLDKSVSYAAKAVELLDAKPGPESDKKKGLANWIAGVSLFNQNKLGPADKSLRAALPLLKDNEQLLQSALFHLGLINYKMAQGNKNKNLAAEAAKFNDQAAAVKGPLAGQAAKNAKVIRAEFLVK